MRHFSRSSLAALGALFLGALGACADAPSAPAFARLEPGAPSAVISTKNAYTITTVGDTTLATITLAPGGRAASYFIGGGQRLDVPGGAEVVCTIATSSYGPQYWNSACSPSQIPVTITAKTWIDGNGFAHADFSPALRFVPTKTVMLFLNSRTGVDVSRQDIRYCTPLGGCIDESLTDPSVATSVASSTQLSRRVKHFSGYNVVVD